jgi:hypothetical protein
MDGNVAGLLALMLVVADSWALVHVWTSGRGVPTRVAWTATIVILPTLGLFVWLAAGPRAEAECDRRYEHAPN